MQRNHLLSAAIALLALAALAAGCSKDDKGPSTAPVTEPFESGNIANGGTFVHTFNTAGSFTYRCRLHSGMSGTIVVEAAGTDSVIVPITDFAFASSGSVKPGGYARWINNGSTHTVSRP